MDASSRLRTKARRITAVLNRSCTAPQRLRQPVHPLHRRNDALATGRGPSRARLQKVVTSLGHASHAPLAHASRSLARLPTAPQGPPRARRQRELLTRGTRISGCNASRRHHPCTMRAQTCAETRDELARALCRRRRCSAAQTAPHAAAAALCCSSSRRHASASASSLTAAGSASRYLLRILRPLNFSSRANAFAW